MSSGARSATPIGDLLHLRAARVVPGGIYGHTDASMLWSGAPKFVKRAQGCRFWDADGREYIDLMCSWGPILHGHGHPVVEEAVARQASQVDCGNAPTAAFVELAELFVDTVEHADWAMFAKNGTDVVTLATGLARARTGKQIILTPEGSHHGRLPPRYTSERTSASDRLHRTVFRFNDLTSVEERLIAHSGNVAGVLVPAFLHNAGEDQELPHPEFVRGLRRLCDIYDAVLIVDDVRAGFRLTNGCSWEQFGVEPDLSAWSKAIANGYPISALLGTDAMREVARTVFIAGSFWMSGVPMAAAIATINVLNADDGLGRMRDRGEQLVQGLREQADRYGLGVRVTGPVTMPYLRFIDDADLAVTERWAAEVANGGVFLHPRHNWFISTAHTVADIDHILEASDRAFSVIAGRM
jgi:glutamate-1-semialdehyde 2,1-aminomutase